MLYDIIFSFCNLPSKAPSELIAKVLCSLQYEWGFIETLEPIERERLVTFLQRERELYWVEEVGLWYPFWEVSSSVHLSWPGQGRPVLLVAEGVEWLIPVTSFKHLHQRWLQEAPKEKKAADFLLRVHQRFTAVIKSLMEPSVEKVDVYWDISTLTAKTWPSIISNTRQMEAWKKLGFTLTDYEQACAYRPRLIVESRFFEPATIEKWGQSLDPWKQSGVLIKGDNLRALNWVNKQSSRPDFRLVYGDPPYNTGQQTFLYQDGREEPLWLSMLEGVAGLLVSVLAKDSYAFFSIDDHQRDTFGLVMRQTFGSGSLMNWVVVKLSELSGVKMAHQSSRLPKVKEYIGAYRFGSPTLNQVNIADGKWNSEYNKIVVGLTKEDRDFIRELVQADSCTTHEVAKLNQILAQVRLISLSDYYRECDITPWSDEKKQKESWRIVQAVGSKSVQKYAAEAECLEQDIAALLSPSGTLYLYWTKFNRAARRARVQLLFADDHSDKPVSDLWLDIKTTGGVGQEGGVLFPNGKKPEKLIERLLTLGSCEHDWVLDPWLGSGTVAAVAMKMKRRWVGIESGAHFEEVTLKRLLKVLQGEQTGVSHSHSWAGGGSFAVLYLNRFEL